MMVTHNYTMYDCKVGYQSTKMLLELCANGTEVAYNAITAFEQMPSPALTRKLVFHLFKCSVVNGMPSRAQTVVKPAVQIIGF